ncbi:MAG TPA: hypothetical protein ENH13_00500 [Euryarchaeota archaeon]|nr:hypothetical protein [Euryarchaeota archaeon]
MPQRLSILKQVYPILLILILLAGCTSGGGVVVEKGDTVFVHYVGKLENGKVFDTNIQDVAENPVVEKTDTFNKHTVYTPLKFTVGAGEVIEGFDDAVIGMKEGETKEVTIPPENGYEWREDLTQVGQRVAVLDKVESVTFHDLTKATGLTEFVVGTVVPWREWKAEIVAVSDETVVLKSIVNTSTINTEVGSFDIVVDTGTITETFTPKEGAEIKTHTGKGKLSIINDTHFLIDFNPPLAGKTLVFDITVDTVEKAQA